MGSEILYVQNYVVVTESPLYTNLQVADFQSCELMCHQHQA